MSPEIREAAREGSTDAFHLAMMVSAGLLLLGAAVNGFGIRNPSPDGRRGGPGAEVAPSDAAGAAGPVRHRDEGGPSPPPVPEHTGPAREA